MDEDTHDILNQILTGMENMTKRIDLLESNLTELIKPVIKIDKELRAHIKKEVSDGKKPRKQPKDTTVWKEAYKTRKEKVAQNE